MTRRVWVVEHREKGRRRWVPSVVSAEWSKADAMRECLGWRAMRPEYEWRVVPYVPARDSNEGVDMKYTKKPVTIEAWSVETLLHQAAHAWDELPEPVRDAYDAQRILFLADGLHVRTLEGTMVANRADYLIRGVAGELYPCKPDIFAATYVPAREEGDP